MRIVSIDKSSTESGRLVLIFTGWATTPELFSSIAMAGYDLAVAYDYRDIKATDSDIRFSDYREICVVAWSFGVIAATEFILNNPELNYTAKIAVNGTLCPVDDTRGIPEATFQATLDALSESSLVRFFRRVCGSASVYKAMSYKLPQRPISDLREELEAIERMTHRAEFSHLWDTVYISGSDLIIPATNQKQAWQGHSDLRIIEGPHLLDFSRMMQQCIINKSLVALRFRKSAKTYTQNASQQKIIAEHLAEIAATTIASHPRNILEIGTGTGMLTRTICQNFPNASATLWDIMPIDSTLPGIHRQCDAEIEISRISDESIDLIASASTIQWFNSPAEFVRRCHSKLTKGGHLLISTFGPDNFQEINRFNPEALHYISAGQWTETLTAAGFTVNTLQSENLIVDFDSTQALIDHIRSTGVNATRPSIAALKAILASGVHTLTYNPIYILAQKPVRK
ncbi:MAG: DUF452 family protein [Bacteroides sp.]|nr:DUF452 family protein [Bacteroides sp.]MCM1412852.1 DUF452 family protein [Bacteroides sp.]MCM1471521.1 DUF452 family protein [Bacteroides sp.]